MSPEIGDQNPANPDLVWAAVHGGASIGWVKSGAPIECNAHCHDGLHCDVIYADRTSTRLQVSLAVTLLVKRHIVRIDPAPEAPPPDLDLLLKFGKGEVKNPVGWLVFWDLP